MEKPPFFISLPPTQLTTKENPSLSYDLYEKRSCLFVFDFVENFFLFYVRQQYLITFKKTDISNLVS